MAGLRKGALLAAALTLLHIVSCSREVPEASPASCQGGSCDPSTHQIDVPAVHYQDEAGAQQVNACLSLLDALALRDDCTQWYGLISRFDAKLGGADQLRATLFVPSDKALNTALATLNYDWQRFLQLDDARLFFILQYLIIPVTATQPLIYASNITWNSPPVTTMFAANTLTLRPNKWRAFQVSDNTSTAEVQQACADQKTCNAVFHVIDNLLLPFPLPALPKRSCMSVYDYISSQGNLQYFKKAVDAADPLGDGTTFASLMKDPTFPATWFIVNDQVMDKWVKLYINQPFKILITMVEHFNEMPSDQIGVMLLSWLIRGQYDTSTLTSGLMLKRLTNDYLLVSHDDGRIRISSTMTSGVIVQPDIRLCAVGASLAMLEAAHAKTMPSCWAIVHELHYPIIPFNSEVWNPFHFDFVDYPEGAPELLLVPRTGSWDTLGDLVCSSPHLSGFRDLIKGTDLEPLMNDPKMLATWYIPTNKALLQWAGETQVTTNTLMSDIQKRINFLNYCVVPYSTLSSADIGDNQQLLTAYRPHYLTITFGADYSVLGDGEKFLQYGTPVALPNIVVGKALCNVLDYNVAYAAAY